jgi:NitT/TauT family transport system substrate-binding protein
MLKHNTLYRPVLCALALLLLAACAPPAPDPEAGDAPAAPVVLKVLMFPFTSYGPYFIAEEEGYFQEQNLAIEWVQLAQYGDAIPLLVSGQLDVVAGTLPVAIFNAIARQGNIRMVADKGVISADECTYVAFMGRAGPDGRPEIQEPAQLAGKRVVVIPEDSSGFFLERWLAPAGLSLDDIEPTFLAAPQRGEAVASGAIDLAFNVEPWLTRALAANQVVVLNPAEVFAEDFQFAAILYGPNLLERDVDAGRRFMIAYLKGARQYNEGKTARNVEILAKHTNLEPELLAETCWPAIRSDGDINLSTLILYQQRSLDSGYQDALVSTDQLWDASFIEYAAQALQP